ncbi:MAG: 3-deoxy-manno-octulosonate cytidylyltransferase, partial [Gemmatimonadetes bacterium]|nr:3-deoxy-manno-octulosonate cytidylyltransferase [Gemmatimonadota bacterium]
MHILCVIPARIGSSRIPHKPLQTIAGQPLIRLVAQRALDFGFLDHVVVATDDRRVADAVADLDV